MSDRANFIFKLFLIVIFIILRGQNFNIDLNSKNFLKNLRKVISTGFQRPPKSKLTFRPIFRQRRAIQKNFLHYKPCLLTSLSSGKSWEIFALSIEKIDFFIFEYTNFSGNLKKVIQPKGQVLFCSNFFCYSSWSY